MTLYGHVTASDLRDQVRELLPTPPNDTAIVEALSSSFPGAIVTRLAGAEFATNVVNSETGWRPQAEQRKSAA